MSNADEARDYIDRLEQEITDLTERLGDCRAKLNVANRKLASVHNSGQPSEREQLNQLFQRAAQEYLDQQMKAWRQAHPVECDCETCDAERKRKWRDAGDSV